MRPQHPRNHFPGGNGQPFNPQGPPYRPQNGFDGGGQRFGGNSQWQGSPSGPSSMRNGPPSGPMAGRSSPRPMAPIQPVGGMERQGPRADANEPQRGGWKKLAPAAPLPAPHTVSMREHHSFGGPSREAALSTRPGPTRQWGGREINIPSGPSSQTNIQPRNQQDESPGAAPGARWRKIAPPPPDELLPTPTSNLASTRGDSSLPRRGRDSQSRRDQSSSSPEPGRGSPSAPKRSIDRRDSTSSDHERPPAKRYRYSQSENSDDDRDSRRQKQSSRPRRHDEDQHGSHHDREHGRRRARDASSTRKDESKRYSRSKRSMSVSSDDRDNSDIDRRAESEKRKSQSRHHRSDGRSEGSNLRGRDDDARDNARHLGRGTGRNGDDEGSAANQSVDRELPPHLAHSRHRNAAPPHRGAPRETPVVRRPSRRDTSRPPPPRRSVSPRPAAARRKENRDGSRQRHRRSPSRSRSRDRQDGSDDAYRRRPSASAENGSRADSRPVIHPSRQQALNRRSRSPSRRRVDVSRSRSPRRNLSRRSPRSPSPRITLATPRQEPDAPMRRWGPRSPPESRLPLSPPPKHEQASRWSDSAAPTRNEPAPAANGNAPPRREALADQGDIFQSGRNRGRDRRRRSSSRRRPESWNRNQDRYRAEHEEALDVSTSFDNFANDEASTAPASVQLGMMDAEGLPQQRLSAVKFSLKGDSSSRPSMPSTSTPNAFSINEPVKPPSDEEELANLRSVLAAKTRVFNHEQEVARPYIRSAFDAMVRADPSMTLAPEAFLRDHLRRPPMAADTITLRTLQGLFIGITGLEAKERELAKKVNKARQTVAKLTESTEAVPLRVDANDGAGSSASQRKPPITPVTFSPRTARSDLQVDSVDGPITSTPARDNAISKAQGTEVGRSADKSEAYHKLAQVGEGTYGKVYKARSNETASLVALKRIRMEGEKDGFPVTAMREIRLLQGIDHPNVVKLHEMMVSKGSVYMVLEYMDHDLTGILSQPQFEFEEQHLKSLCQQMLSGLEYLHDHSILHRDMKGSNILLNSRGELKLADFGLARVYHKRRQHDYTNRVITLWYRSPELLLGETMYGPAVDMWSAGCIMLELFVRKPIFQGQDEISQLDVIYSLMGTPNENIWPGVATLPWWELVKPKATIESGFVEYAGKYLTSAGMDVASGLLTMDPTRRLSATQALSMPYFTEHPTPELPSHIAEIQGEWHEMEAKQERARKRHRDSIVKNDQTGVAMVGEADLP